MKAFVAGVEELPIKSVNRKQRAALLADLKDLVDSFQEDQRKEVMKLFATVFTALAAGDPDISSFSIARQSKEKVSR